MNSFALKLALRELRGGLRGFRVFLLCLMLGVAGIAAVGSIAAAISKGLSNEGRNLLGGDIAVTLTYRLASAEEAAWLETQGELSTIVDLRSMIGAEGADGAARALAQVKAVDDAYPLYGAVGLSGPDNLTQALGKTDDLWGLITEPVLAERLGLEPGDSVSLGAATFEFRGTLTQEPDGAAGGFALGPRVLVSLAGLQAAGLTQPGTLFESTYRLKLPVETDLGALRREFEDLFAESGARFRDRSNAAPGVQRFVDRTGAFLTLVGLAALVTGGVGVGAAVRGYLNRKIPTIAALRTQGATAGQIFSAYLIQISVLAGLGIFLGLVLGGGLVAALGPVFAKTLPVPAEFALYPSALAIAALFGGMVALLFALWPLSWLREVRPAQLFRELDLRTVPRVSMLLLMVALTAGAAAIVIWLSGAPKLAIGVLGSIAAALLVLRALGWLTARLARRLSHSALGRRRPGLRLALGAIGAPGSDTANVVMALGLGLGVLAAIGQIDSNLQRLVSQQLPSSSPAFFFVDIQSDQREPFIEMLDQTKDVGDVETAPMLRGVLTRLNGVPAGEAEIDPAAAWVLRGDRGVTYSAVPPPGAVLTEGAWWPEDYSGEPLVSFAEEEGRELGLSIGSTLTVNVLGRPITARVASFREVEWRGMGINFLMVLSPNALAGAPHTHIATVHAGLGAEAAVLRQTADAFPNVTAIPVRAQITRVSNGLAKLGAATQWGALAVLLTGLAVLIGAAGAAAESQTREAALLKVLGSERRGILASFALRSALLGALAGGVGLIWGGIAAWGVTRFVLDAEFALEIPTALAIVAGGALVNLFAGLVFAARPLRLRAAGVLRNVAQ